MWLDYLKETLGTEGIVTDRGFITFQFADGVCVIHDFYVKPEWRGTKEAIILAEMVRAMATEKGCKAIGAEVYLARPGADKNLGLFKHWKMEETSRTDHRVILMRQLENDHDGQIADYRRS